MCGIVGATAERNVVKILVEGLHRLEYRGYDSAGLALVDGDSAGITAYKRLGKVANLENALKENPHDSHVGIAHTRWATHGKPSETNAHPHLSADSIALVHNGIIENHAELRDMLVAEGYEFVSETDTEVIVHLVHKYFQQQQELFKAVKSAIAQLDGAFALAVLCKDEPNHIVVARSGSPLVIGVGIDENFIASDQLALRQVTDRFIFLEEGDMADVSCDQLNIFDVHGELVEREVVQLDDYADASDKGQFRHYMMKEIFEQPKVVAETLRGRLGKHQVMEEIFGADASSLFDRVKRVQIVACGTSYHTGVITRYWLESIAKVPCNVEIASEFRYRDVVVEPDTIFITISQSGETADTLAALRKAKDIGYTASLTICNAPASSLVRESDLVLMTQAGPEIGVASTKAFTTQLVSLLLFTLVIGRRNGLTPAREQEIVSQLNELSDLCAKTLELADRIKEVSNHFTETTSCLFLGRGMQYPVAMEGALKLKEISYIHAEAYPAGELKHGPLALVDSETPIVAVAPNNDLLEKLKSNLEEVRARGGRLYVFADVNSGFSESDGVTVINVPHVSDVLEPLIYTIPLQLLSYYVAVLRGTDVDQPRNLAKSVTVE